MNEEKRFDFHTHSSFSDGSDSPETLLGKAKEKGVRMLALTDHDTMDGYKEAAAAGERLGVKVLPAVEMDTEFSEELHILGLNVDPLDPGLIEALQRARVRRNARNERMLDKLKQAGYDVARFVDTSGGTVTRLHIARALAKAGFADGIYEAFEKFLNKGAVGYCTVERFTPEEVIEIISNAGGVAALAHPCHLKCGVHALVKRLVDAGLSGIEAYYPTSSEGQTKTFLSLANQYGLLVTAGSDYHGPEREKHPLGSAWRDVPALEKTFDYFSARLRAN